MNSEAPIAIGPEQADTWLVLAHGAGQGPDSPFMDGISARLAAAGLRVLRFSFPYMLRMRQDGRRRPPDREPVLREHFATISDQARADGRRLLIGGKSMGGRIASLIADEAGADGLICLGFPFHPPGKPERWRGAHLAEIATPTLICQGERDPFGHRRELADRRLSPAVTLCWITDGEHSFKPGRSSGRNLDDNLQQAADAVTGFVAGISETGSSQLQDELEP